MSTALPCEKLLIGISGSIHCAQIGGYLAQFRREFATSVRVIMTQSACDMVNPKTVELHTDVPVITDIWGNPQSKSPHITATRWADLFLVLPASANILGKAAHGIADDLLSTAIVASRGPIVFAPAMNPSMWESAAVQRNLRTLREDGHYIIPPQEITSVTTGDYDTGLGPTPESVMPHLWHVLMKHTKDGYWDEATRTQPMSPAERVRQSLPLLANAEEPATV
ncbi:flavoprotein [Streptomyces sp. NPDC004065]|uniref:flavoprotein n=1 Tax=Streptomyces sp. NPDC004065 TaxID=3364689 RepID=UPI00384E9E6F